MMCARKAHCNHQAVQNGHGFEASEIKNQSCHTMNLVKLKITGQKLAVPLNGN